MYRPHYKRMYYELLETKRALDATLYCTFCDKNQYDVRKLIAGPRNVFICDECVAQCVETIKES